MSTPQVTVILPAYRDPDRAQEIVDRLLEENTANIEVAVTSPNFYLEGATNYHDDMVGASRCIARCYQAIRTHGTFGHNPAFVAWLSDICIPMPRCIDHMIEFVSNHDAPFIGEFMTRPANKEGHYRVCTIKGRQYARWGMLSCLTIEQLGGFFDYEFESYYGDVDLSLRCWRAGGQVGTCTNAIINMRGHHHLTNEPLKLTDEQVFVGRWKDEYPALITEHTSEWNVDRELPL